MNLYPRGFGGERTDPEIIKREGWRGMGTLTSGVVSYQPGPSG